MPAREVKIQTERYKQMNRKKKKGWWTGLNTAERQREMQRRRAVALSKKAPVAAEVIANETQAFNAEQYRRDMAFKKRGECEGLIEAIHVMLRHLNSRLSD
jgi:hypothetical protein